MQEMTQFRLVLAEQKISAHIEPTQAMAVLVNVAKPLQTTDNIFMSGSRFFESGLRDDVSIANLQEARLKLVVLAKTQARELHVDWQVERANNTAAAQTAVPTAKSKGKPMQNTDKPVCRFFLEAPSNHKCFSVHFPE